MYKIYKDILVGNCYKDISLIQFRLVLYILHIHLIYH